MKNILKFICTPHIVQTLQQKFLDCRNSLWLIHLSIFQNPSLFNDIGIFVANNDKEMYYLKKRHFL